MSQSESDSLSDIGRDVAIKQLKTTRKTIASRAFQERVVDEVDESYDVPMVPEALEENTLNTIYDFVQDAAVGAIDRLIASLKA